MGLILNPRGIGGSGKTELVRRILGRYGWQRGAYATEFGKVEPLYRQGRNRPYGYRLAHPHGGRPLVVLGHYEVTSGGCDTIRLADGGIAEVARSADSFASSGHDVVIEGLRLSSEVEHSLTLAQLHDFRVLWLATPLRQCVRNLAGRRRLGAKAVPPVVRAAEANQKSVEAACEQLRLQTSVEAVTFDEALARAESLLELSDPMPRWI